MRDQRNSYSWLGRGLPALLVLSLTVVGCGSGGGGGSSDSDGSDVLTGTFVDSKVANVDYATESQSGTTNADGEFQYKEGEKVEFSIGGIELPSASGKEVVTPLDMSSDGTLDNQAVNVARLLQTLDENGDPSDGINVSDDTKEAAKGVALDFSKSKTEFETDASNNLLSGNNINSGNLVAESDAKEHLSNTLAEEGVSEATELVGSYRYGTDVVLVFAADGSFYMAEYNSTEIQSDQIKCLNWDPEVPEEDREPSDCWEWKNSGLERGSYSYVDGRIYWDISDDRNGQVGFLDSGDPPSEEESVYKVVELTDSQLTIEEESTQDQVTFDRINSTAGSFSGAWGATGAVLIFDGDMSNGKYFMMQYGDEDQDLLGVEKGSYSFSDGVLTPSATEDENSDAGLASPNETFTYTFSVDEIGRASCRERVYCEV